MDMRPKTITKDGISTKIDLEGLTKGFQPHQYYFMPIKTTLLGIDKAVDSKKSRILKWIYFANKLQFKGSEYIHLKNPGGIVD